jgi:hypothetical protein
MFIDAISCFRFSINEDADDIIFEDFARLRVRGADSENREFSF